MTTAEAIASLREQMGDNADSNFVRNENLASQVTVTNKTFFLDEFRKEMGSSVVSGSITLTSNGNPITNTLVSPAQGKVTVPTVPVNPLLASYNWQYFSDPKYTQFLTDSLNLLQYDTVDLVPGALRQALVYYAISKAYDALANHANMILRKKDAVIEIDGTKAPDTWTKMSKEAFDKAQKIQEQYNRGMFTQLRPVGRAHVANLGNQTWTPTR